MQASLVKMFMMNDLRRGDSNGQMDLGEFEELCQEVLDLNFTEREARTVFRYLDVDRSGQITVEELTDELMCLEVTPTHQQPRKSRDQAKRSSPKVAAPAKFDPSMPAHTGLLSSKYTVRPCRICRGSCSCDLQNLLVCSPATPAAGARSAILKNAAAQAVSGGRSPSRSSSGSGGA